MKEEEKEAVITVNNIEYRKKDIEKLINFFYKIQNAYIQAEFDCNQFKKQYLETLEENKKYKKENEELKKEIERQKDINTVINEKGLDKNYEKALEKTMTKFLKNNIANDFISKQKVKDVIKEVKEKQENNQKYNISDWEDYDVHEEIICYLQDLLESEE